jgi:ATP-dependent RNA helicase DeaD
VAKAAVIHGDLPQSQRERIMAAFRTGDIKYLIATDVMSRGIDVDNISHVINYDLPTDIENYVHRIGRTGRIGKDGVAISFVTPEQGGQLTDIEVTINRLIERDELPGEWYTPRKVSAVPTAAPPAPPVKRDEQGWGVEDDLGPIEKLGTSESDPVATDTEPAADSSAPNAPAKKSVFGKTRRRYTDRL